MSQTNKSKQINKQTSTSLRTNKKNRVLLRACALALIFTSWMLVRKNIILPRQEKARFGFAEQQINLALNKVTINAQNLKEEKECFHPHGKFESSYISCRFTIEIPLSALKPGIDSQAVFAAFDAMPQFKQYTSNDGTHKGYSLNNGKFSCSVDLLEGSFQGYTILCNGGATKPIYPGL
jgi:hypothetical protein